MPREYIGRRTIHYEITESTNDRAAELASDPDYSGVCITAGMQSRGRGQQGRSWFSQPDRAILMSLLLHPPEILRRPAILTAWVAVGVVETVCHFTGINPRIKWPNDVLVQGRKICGILIESGQLPGYPPHFVVGVGCNINVTSEEFARAELDTANSLAMIAGREFVVSEVTDYLLNRLDGEYTRISQGQLDSLEAAWRWHIGLQGRPVTIERMNGECLEGHLQELSFSQIILDRGINGVMVIPPEEIRHIRGHA